MFGFNEVMADNTEVRHVVSASREIAARADQIFELIADPSQQPQWDGNDNLTEAPTGQRVHGVDDVFTMTTTKGSVRENHVVEFEEGVSSPGCHRNPAKNRRVTCGGGSSSPWTRHILRSPTPTTGQG